jgi:hypothetical protein
MQYDEEILEKTGIFYFHNAVSAELCDETIKAFYDNPKKHFNGQTGGGYRPSVKNTTDWHIHLEHLNRKYFSVLNIATEVIKSKRVGLKFFNVAYSGLQFQKNEKDKGFFKWHSDNDERNLNEARILAPIFYLNDVPKGGETEFLYQDFKVKPQKGLLVIFPCTWTYYHRGVKPLSNDKYIITTFGLIPR